MSGDCRTFQYWKDLRLKYLKERKSLQREYEFFKGSCKKLRRGKLKDEAMLIKERLNKDELATFTASNGWLEKFKQCTNYVRRGLLVKRTRYQK